MKDEMEKCYSCKFYNKEKSNKNWVVCSVMTFDVIVEQMSEDCEKYKKIEE